MIKLGVLASTRGTDMQYIIDKIESKELDAEISVVISNKADCYALERAKKHKIKTVFVEPKGKTREEFDKEVAKAIEEKQVELILAIGYMRYLSKWFVDKYKNRIMNVHPSLLPAFAGGMDKNVHQAILDWGVKISGCTIHFIDEGEDTGPIILQRAITVEEDETVDSLKEKIQKLEGEMFIEAITLFKDGKLKVEGRCVRISK